MMAVEPEQEVDMKDVNGKERSIREVEEEGKVKVKAAEEHVEA